MAEANGALLRKAPKPLAILNCGLAFAWATQHLLQVVPYLGFLCQPINQIIGEHLAADGLP